MTDTRDRDLLADMALRKQIDVRFADSCNEAHALAHQLKAPVVLCDRDSQAGEWRELVKTLAAIRQRPSVVLASQVVDEYLWREVIRNGGYDVLAKPLREDDVLRSVRLAWLYWHSAQKRYEISPLRTA